MIDPEDLSPAFHAAFGRSPRVYRAPGRVNLIGEHTDYNDGFVMPMALDRSTWVAAAPRADRTIVVRSREYDETQTIAVGPYSGTCEIPGHPLVVSLSNHEPSCSSFDRLRTSECTRPSNARHSATTGAWSDYVRGVATVIGAAGADLLIASDVPIGAGLSSSAALEVAVGYALLDLAGRPIDLTKLALACQRAEHEFAGTRCGVMDQMIACHARAGHAMMLDTRSLQARWLPLPATVRLVVCNTMVTHRLAAGEYNARRADCEAGVRMLSRRWPEIRALRDVTFAQLEIAGGGLSNQVYRRCRHVITENARVEQAAAALSDGDFACFGRLMGDSHRSLRDDYEVSCAELDAMVTIAAGLAGVYGARMTGGGFGGCAVALVDAEAADEVQAAIARDYQRQTGLRPDIWVCSAGAGAGELTGVIPR